MGITRPLPFLLRSRCICANQGVDPQICAGCVDECVPAPEAGHGDAILLDNGLTPVTRNNLVVAAAVRHDARHGRGGTRNANTGVVA